MVLLCPIKKVKAPKYRGGKKLEPIQIFIFQTKKKFAILDSRLMEWWCERNRKGASFFLAQSRIFVDTKTVLSRIAGQGENLGIFFVFWGA